MRWISTKEALPERLPNVKYSTVKCLVVVDGRVYMHYFNHEHECWDDAEGDDYAFDIDRVSHWMLVPKPPEI